MAIKMFNRIRNILKKKEIKENKLPTVKSDVKEFLSEKDVVEQINIIKEKYNHLIFNDKDIIKGILSGFDLRLSGDALRNLNREVSNGEINSALLWLSSRCNYIYRSNRSISIGITEARWISSNFCGYKGNDKFHDKFHGMIFNLKDGLVYQGKVYYPGCCEYCKCGYKSILPF